jgi:hypothetical protein
MDPARIEEDPLGSRGFTGIDVGHDADISEQVKGGNSGHLETGSSLFSILPSVLCNKKERRNKLGDLSGRGSSGFRMQ